MAINTDTMLNMLNDINLSALNDTGMFQELEVFAKELMNSSNPAHRFAALKINNRLQENPYYQNYLKTELIQKEEINVATDKRFENAYQAHRENASIANIQNRRQEERKEKEDDKNSFNVQKYKPDYVLYEKIFNKYGLSWNELSIVEKEMFEKEDEKIHNAIIPLTEKNNIGKDDVNKLVDNLNKNNAITYLKSRGKISEEKATEEIRQNYREVLEIFSKDRNLSDKETLERLEEVRRINLELIKNNKFLTEEEKNKLEHIWRRETDAVTHLYKIKQNILNGEEVNMRDVEFMLGALHLEKPGEITLNIVESLFFENREVLDYLLANKKEDFINLLVSDGDNKYQNLIKLIEKRPELGKILKEEYGIDLKELKVDEKKGFVDNNQDYNNLYVGKKPSEDINKVTNNGELYQTIDNHPNVGEKVSDQNQQNIKEDKNLIATNVAIVKSSEF